MSSTLIVPAQAQTVTPAAFWDQLNKADWFYEYSDSHASWKLGDEAMKALVATSNTSPELRALYQGFVAHHFSGKPWGSEKAAKPERPAP